MKEVMIHIKIDELSGKIATAIKNQGYKRDNICHQLELLGIIENLVTLQKNKLRVLLTNDKNYNEN